LAGVGTNRYAYAGNDPVNKSDANGHTFGSWLSGLLNSLTGGSNAPSGSGTGGMAASKTDRAIKSGADKTAAELAKQSGVPQIIDGYKKGDKKKIAEGLLIAASNLPAGRVARGLKAGGELVGIGTKTFYRSMSKAEATAVAKTGQLRGGRSGPTYFTDSKFKTAERAKDRLSLEVKPEVQMEFRVKNQPSMERNGTRVTPASGGSGGGREYSTPDLVEVEIINVQPF
jgi:hypothetical protein